MKNRILIYLVVILAIFLISCNDNFDTQKNEITNSISESFDTDVPDTGTADFFNFYYRLPSFNLVIVEIGEFLEIEIPPKENLSDEEYIGVAVKIIKDFENAFSQHTIQNNHHRRMSFLKSEIRFEITERYDDIILVPVSQRSQLEVGASFLAELYTTHLNKTTSSYIPFLCISSVNICVEDANKESHYEEVLRILPIIDNKIVIPEKLSSNDKSFKGYGNAFMWAFGTANENLKKLGLDDILFGDGITIDRLEKYLELVTDTKTFEPLLMN